MLGKLLKYEIKATGRIFLPLYAVLFLFAIITRIFNPGAGFNSEFQAGSGAMQITGGIMMAAYVSIIVAIFVVTVVMMIQRFYKNLLSDEGYLMFTLPVRPWKHIASKLIVSVLWIVVSGIVTMLSVAVLVSTWELWKAIPDAFAKLIEMINQYFGASGYWFGLEMLLLMLTSLVLGILLIYAAIALGHLFTRHRTTFWARRVSGAQHRIAMDYRDRRKNYRGNVSGAFYRFYNRSRGEPLAFMARRFFKSCLWHSLLRDYKLCAFKTSESGINLGIKRPPVYDVYPAAVFQHAFDKERAKH